MKAILLVLASVGSALASPGVSALRDQDRAAATEASFRRRNLQRWSAVAVDPRGFVQHVRTDQPVDAAALLRANADLFGIDAADADHLSGPRSHQRFVEAIDRAVIASIDVRVARATTDITVHFRLRVTPTVREDDLRARLLGRRYAETTAWALRPMLDCAMTQLGAAGCVMPVDSQETHQVTLVKRDLRVSTSLMTTPDGALHLIRCADASKRPRRLLAYHEVRTRSFAPLDGAPSLPLVVDAVTGDAIATAARDCSAAVLTSGREHAAP